MASHCAWGHNRRPGRARRQRRERVGVWARLSEHDDQRIVFEPRPWAQDVVRRRIPCMVCGLTLRQHDEAIRRGLRPWHRFQW
jgi:hypothetical protein